MIKKEITNKELALMMKEGFDAVDKRFEQVDKRFATKEDFRELEENIRRDMATKFDIKNILNAIGGMVKNLVEIKIEQAGTNENYRRLDKEVEKHDNQIKILEEQAGI